MPESQVPIRVKISGSYKTYPALIVNHDGYEPRWATPINIYIGTTRREEGKEYVDKILLWDYRLALTRRHANAAEFAVFRLRKPFILVIDTNDLISDSGMHKVLINPSYGVDQGHYKFVPNLYRIKDEITFPRGARPTEEEWKNSVFSEHIAWIVREKEVQHVLLLDFVSGGYQQLEVWVTFRGEPKLEQIQGHLLGAPAELKSDKLSSDVIDAAGIPWRQQLRIFNHTIVPKSMEVAAVVIPWVELNGVLGRLYVIYTIEGAWVRSKEHGEAELPKGWYVLFHRYPSPVSD